MTSAEISVARKDFQEKEQIEVIIQSDRDMVHRVWICWQLCTCTMLSLLLDYHSDDFVVQSSSQFQSSQFQLQPM
jgi:hypothetical protein